MLSELAKKLVPYKAGEQPRGVKFIKLNTNENPYPPSSKVFDAIRAFDISRLRLYPDPECNALKDAIALKEGVKKENIFVGNGSDEVLGFAFLAMFDKKLPVKFAELTYSFYPVYCRLFGLPYETVPLTGDLLLNRAQYKNCGGIVIANPNAPTGIYEDVSEFLNRKLPVIIDEAYVDFSGHESLCKLAAQSPYAMVVKTFSKSYSLAGMRCGYAVAHEETIEGMRRVKDSFNSYTVNAVTQAAATAAIADEAYHCETVEKVCRTRDSFIKRLREKGYECPDSKTNFILATVPDGDGKGKYEYLKANGVLVRWFDADGLRDKLRITVGTDEEMETLYELL